MFVKKYNNMSIDDENKEVLVEQISADALYSSMKAEVDIQISTAKTYPRNVTKAINNAIAIVTLDDEIAKTCHYSIPRDGKNVSGASVHLAKILAQNWGNMRCETKVVSIDNKHVTSQAIAFDLENNLAIKVEVKKSITKRDGTRFSDDMVTVTGNATNAIALRNAIFHVVPRGVVDKVYNAAKKAITGDVSDKAKLIAKRKEVVDALKDTYSLTEKQILTAIKRPSTELINADDLITLIGFGTSIKEGDSTVEEVFGFTTTDKSDASAADKAKSVTEKIEKKIDKKDESRSNKG